MAVDAEAQFHVLAVDDSLMDRKLIERLLKTSSFQVTTVDSGSKALEFLGLREDHSPEHNEIEVNLVITDYCMPGMTGYDLLKKIKESSSLKDIPVVIMSSENVPSRINRCLEGGAEEFFLKPVQLSDMKKLRPHIFKGKSKDHQLQEQEEEEEEEEDIKDAEAVEVEDEDEDEEEAIKEAEVVGDEDEEEEEANKDSKNKNTSESSKRKAMDEEIGPERRRLRFSSSDEKKVVVF